MREPISRDLFFVSGFYLLVIFLSLHNKTIDLCTYIPYLKLIPNTFRCW